MEIQVIQNKIHEIRGCRVMLDFDLAELYQVKTKVLKQAVKRNNQRFPSDFMFQLSKDEWNELVTNCDQLPENLKHSYINPTAFTEQGVAMLSTVLRSDTAINMNINIMRAFVAARNYVLQQSSMTQEIEELWKAINDLSEDNRKEFDDIYLALAELANKQKVIDKPCRPIGFQHYNK